MNIDDMLSNLIYSSLHTTDPQDASKKILAIEGTPEIIYIFLERIAPENFHKKKYYHAYRISIPSRMDAWIFNNLVDNEQFGKYLDRYRGKKGINSENIDQHILRRHYYSKALSVLKQRKNFDLAVWTKPRYELFYERKSNLFLKDGTPIGFDFRNKIVVIFTIKQRENRRILAIGGGGGSSQRQDNTLFTAVYYLLSRKKSVRYHFIKYDSYNQFKYIRSYRRILVTDGFGSNFNLNKKLEREIRKTGIDAYKIPEIRKQLLFRR